MLVYFPATISELRQLANDGTVTVQSGWAITEALRTLDVSLDSDDWQYHVLYSAADQSLELPGNDGRRIVIAAEVDRASEVDDPGPGMVKVDAQIELDSVDAFYLDVPDASGEVDYEGDLAWFARQEIGDLAA